MPWCRSDCSNASLAHDVLDRPSQAPQQGVVLSPGAEIDVKGQETPCRPTLGSSEAHSETSSNLFARPKL